MTANKNEPIEAAEIVSDATPIEPSASAPTQVRRPLRSTGRTIFQALIGLCVLLPILVTTAGLDPKQLPWLAVVLAVAGATTRVMALPGVEEWLRKFVPFLAAAPDPTKELRKRDEAGAVDNRLLLGLILLGLGVILMAATTFNFVGLILVVIGVVVTIVSLV